MPFGRRRSEPLELLPVLWGAAEEEGELLGALARRAVADGRMFVALARTRTGPQGRLQMGHVTADEVARGRDSFEDLMATAETTLKQGLRVDVRETDAGTVVTLERPGRPAAAVVTFADFHPQMSQILGEGELVIGVPSIFDVMVARAATPAAAWVAEAIAAAPAPEPGWVTPTVLRLSADGLSFP